MMIPVIFLVGCSTSGMNDKNVSKEAISPGGQKIILTRYCYIKKK